MLDLRKTLNLAHSTLERNGIDHALIGGFALAVYGNHRATSDIDFLADGTKKDLIKACLLREGFVLSYESPEVLQFSGPGFLDVLLAHRPLSQEMLKNSVKNSILGVYVLRAEDLVGLKIQAYKNDSTREFQTLEEYFQFLEQYWMIFEPPKLQKPKKEYKLLLI